MTGTRTSELAATAIIRGTHLRASWFVERQQVIGDESGIYVHPFAIDQILSTSIDDRLLRVERRVVAHAEARLNSLSRRLRRRHPDQIEEAKNPQATTPIEPRRSPEKD